MKHIYCNEIKIVLERNRYFILKCIIFAFIIDIFLIHSLTRFGGLTFIGRCIAINFCSKPNHMHQSLEFILFWNSTLHVSGGLSVHHPGFKTVHTATGLCQLLPTCQQAVSSICLTHACCCMYSREFLIMEGKIVRNMQSAISK